jgi:hypothetical protein
MLGRRKFASCLAMLLWLASSVVQTTFAQSKPKNSQPAPPRADGQWHRFDENSTARGSQSPAKPPENQRGHAGDWLRRYKDMPPAQQRRALENDPQFRRLSPQQQARLQNRLQRFSALPPQQQERVLNRMETWEHLTQDQKREARQVYQQFRQLPPERRQAINRAIRNMRTLSPERREDLLNSEQYQRAFSPDERRLLDQASRLPLARGDTLQETPDE